MLTRNLAAMAALGMGALATAQTSGNDSRQIVNLSGLSVKGGVSISLDSKLSDRLGTTLTMIGAEFQPLRTLVRGSETYFCAEIHVRDYSGSDGYVIPITINQRFYAGGRPEGLVRRTYGFVGIGAAFVDARRNTNGNAETSLVLHGGVGAELSERIFAEVGLYLGDQRGNARPNLVTFSAGYRF